MHSTPFPTLPRRRLWLTMAGLVLAMLLAALDQTIVGTALPRIIAELNGFDHYAWVTTAYMLASTAVVPIVGKLSDMYGRKMFLIGGTAFFLFASMLCGLSQNMVQLSLFRGLQGIGAGILMGTIFTVIGILFPPAERGKVQGIFSAVFGFASVAGPLLGGYLTDHLTWRWVFYVNLPVGLIALVVLWLTFTDVRTHQARGGVDVLGAVALVAGVVPLLLALTWGGHDYAWSSPQVLGLLALAAVMLGSLLVIETRVAEPIIPLDLFKNRIVTMSIVASSLMSIGMFGVIVYLPLFFQAVMGTSATESGLVLAPLMVAMFGASIVAGQVVSRTGWYKAMGVGGLGVGTVGLFLLAVMPADVDHGTILRNMIVVGAGIGCTFPVFVIAAQNATSLRQIGVVTSLTQFCRQIGATLGIAVFGSVLVSRFAPAFHEALTPQVAANVPPEWLARFDNPQALVNPEALGLIQQGMAALGPSGEQAYAALLAATRLGLATALHEVFLAGAVLLLLGTVAAAFVPELPLKRYEQGSPPVEAMAPPGPPAPDGEAAERAAALHRGDRGAA
jgi:EmrB/QacA subfamily drug resistance transporter